jgi:hypothetical protein
MRVDGRLVFSDSALILNSALVGFGLAYLTEQQVQKHRDSGELVAGARQLVPALLRRQPSAARGAEASATRLTDLTATSRRIL